jgi:hypothetical protein
MHAISPLTIYLWQQVDKWQNSTTGIMILTGMLSLFYFVLVKGVIYEGKPAPFDWIPKWIMIPLFIVCGLVNFLLPSSKTIAMMAVIPAVADSRVVQQDIPELYTIAIEALKAQLKPATKEGK